MFWGLVVISDSLIMGSISFYIIKKIFGDGPLGRILAVIGCIICGFLYFSLCGWACTSYYIKLFLFLLIVFGPIGFVLLVMLLDYAFKGKKNN